MEKSIIDGNKLIALFDGWEYDKSDDLYYRGQNEFCYIRNEKLRPFPEMKYHSSWDWLMPVVEKIRELHTNKNIKREDLSEAADRIFCLHFISARIDIVYNSVVSFIHWYTRQPK